MVFFYGFGINFSVFGVLLQKKGSMANLFRKTRKKKSKKRGVFWGSLDENPYLSRENGGRYMEICWGDLDFFGKKGPKNANLYNKGSVGTPFFGTFWGRKKCNFADA